MTSIVLTATPGTGVVFTIAAAVRSGVRVGVVAALGCTLGILPHLILAVGGAAALLAASPVAFEALKWLGVAYLLYLAWGMWRQGDSRGPTHAGQSPRDSAGRVIVSAILVNLLNPKLTMFFLVFLPMFVDPGNPGAAWVMAQLGGVLMGITFVVFAGYALIASRLTRRGLTRSSGNRWAAKVFSVTFVGLALALAGARL